MNEFSLTLKINFWKIVAYVVHAACNDAQILIP